AFVLFFTSYVYNCATYQRDWLQIMIFQYTFGQILTNEKTQTRRIINPNEFAVRGLNNKIMAVATGDRVKWCVGQTYSVQPGRGKSGIARIRLTAINSEKLGRISSADARREGFKDRQDFLRTWKQIHGIVDM